jgi:hypothetical protein
VRRESIFSGQRYIIAFHNARAGAVLEVEPESGLVLLISRNDGEFAMTLVKNQ